MPSKKCDLIQCEKCGKCVNKKCVKMHTESNCVLTKVKEYYQAVVRCPLCLKKLKYSSFLSHYTNLHCIVIQRAQGIRHTHLIPSQRSTV